MPIVEQNKGVNNNTRKAIDMEYQNRLNHSRFKSPYFGISRELFPLEL